MKKDQIKTITEELLKQLNDAYNQGKPVVDEDGLSVDSRSETSSVADEREIQHKLQQILHLLTEKKSEEQIQAEEQQEVERHGSDMKEQFVQEVYSESTQDGMDLFII